MAYWQNLPVRLIPIGGFRGLDETVALTKRPLGSLSAVSNLVMDPESVLTTRPGLTALGSALAVAVSRGVFQYKNLAGTTTQTLAQAGQQLSYTTGSSWTSITASAPDKAFTGANLNDYGCLFYSGSAAQRWNGTALATLGGSPPQGEFVTESHDQLFVCGIPTREGDLDYCDVGDPETWTPASTNEAGSITISTYPAKWVATDRGRDKVLIWTTHALHILFGPETEDDHSLWSQEAVSPRGTSCGRTVQNVNGTWIWLTNNEKPKGFAMWSGGETRVIEKPISTSLGTIDWSNVANSCSWIDEDGRYCCSCPTTSATVLFMYDPRYDAWFTGKVGDFRASGIVTVDGADIPLIGNNVGAFYKVTGSDDAGTAIAWSATVGPSVLGDAFRGKELKEVTLGLSLNAGASAKVDVDTNETGNFGTSRSISAETTFSQVPFTVPISPSDVAHGTLMRMRLSGSGVVSWYDAELKVYQRGK